MEEIRLIPGGPAFAKPHPKKESTWHKQFQGEATADLKDYPSSEGMLQAWKTGQQEAFKLCMYVGISPDDNVPDASDWFFHPFQDPGNIFHTDDLIIEDETEDIAPCPEPCNSTHSPDLGPDSNSQEDLEEDTTAPQSSDLSPDSNPQEDLEEDTTAPGITDVQDLRAMLDQDIPEVERCALFFFLN